MTVVGAPSCPSPCATAALSNHRPSHTALFSLSPLTTRRSNGETTLIAVQRGGGAGYLALCSQQNPPSPKRQAGGGGGSPLSPRRSPTPGILHRSPPAVMQHVPTPSPPNRPNEWTVGGAVCGEQARLEPTADIAT